MGLPTASPPLPAPGQAWSPGRRDGGPSRAEPCLEPSALFIVFLSRAGFSWAQASRPGRSRSACHCLPRLTVPWAEDARDLQGAGFPGVQPRDPRPGVSSTRPFLLA